MNKEKTRKIKIVILSIVIAGLVVLFIYHAFGKMIPELWPVLKSGNEDDIEKYLEMEGRWDGMLCVALLQFIQVISIFIPGTPIQIAAGVAYGVWVGFILCYLGYGLSNILVFFTARKFGSQKIQSIVPIKMKNNWLEKKMDSENPFIVVILACLVPIIPNGLIPYVAASTKITLQQFSLAIAIGSIFPIIMSSIAGRLFLSGKYILGVGALLVNLLVILIIYKNQDSILEKLRKIKK